MKTFNQPTVVTFTGPSCSGKNHLLNSLLELNFSKIVTNTTRPMRVGEINGVDYNFVDDTFFSGPNIIEYVKKNDYFYGISKENFNKVFSYGNIPVVILSPEGVPVYRKELIKHGISLFSIFVFTKENIRRDRLCDRYASELTGIDSMVDIKNILKEYETRLIEMLRVESTWHCKESWDLLVDGVDCVKAISHIQQGIDSRNKNPIFKI